MQAGLDEVWPYASSCSSATRSPTGSSARGVAADPALLEPQWRATVEEVLAEATLTVPETTWRPTGGRRGAHTTGFGYLLAELQHLHRSHPGATLVTTADATVREVLADRHRPGDPGHHHRRPGILRDVQVDDGHVTVTITPTYSGCPAMDEIRADIRAALAARGVDDVEVRTVLAPAWTTDWMTEAGRERLRAYGIAPPTRRAGGPVLVALGRPAARRRARSAAARDTEELTRFASTSCKSLWRCRSCREPFDHFKDH